MSPSLLAKDPLSFVNCRLVFKKMIQDNLGDTSKLTLHEVDNCKMGQKQEVFIGKRIENKTGKVGLAGATE